MIRTPPSLGTRAGHVALVGLPNVGKSTLLNALLGETIAITSPYPQTTRQTVRGVLTRGDTQFVILDTPGLHAPRTKLGQRMNEAARSAARDADAVVILVESPRDGESPTLRRSDLDVASEMGGRRGAVLAITKVDRLKDKTLLLPFLASITDRCSFDAVVPISAKRADGIGVLLDRVREFLPSQPFFFDAETLSDQPVRFFVAEFVREQVLRHIRQEVPHGVAVVVERFDESGPVAQVEVALHVTRETHKKILVGAKGQMMKTIGISARRRVELMLSRKVNLKLWVQATPGWMDDDAKLRDLGYGKGDGA
jgi:GTP-binding protein Era